MTDLAAVLAEEFTPDALDSFAEVIERRSGVDPSGVYRRFAAALREASDLSLVAYDGADLDGESQPIHHVYLSTGCLHGQHGYCKAMVGYQGEKRPAQCKFCGARCVCVCHGQATQQSCTDEPEPTPEVDLLAEICDDPSDEDSDYGRGFVAGRASRDAEVRRLREDAP